MIDVAPLRQEQWTAALTRARAEKVRLWLTNSGWRARSEKSYRTYSLLAMQLGGDTAYTLSCSCPAVQWGIICKHTARLAVRLSNRGYTIRVD